MRTPWILALLLFLVPGISRAEERSESAVRAEIAAIDGQLRGIEKMLEGRVAKDARMQRALEECERMDAIYTGYRDRLHSTQQAANRAHREYCKQWRLSSVLWPCNARQVLWWFSDLSYVGRITNWKRWGPYAKSFMKARNEFWARRDTYEGEKKAVQAELSHDTELPSLGLGVFDDYFEFKDAYLKRKSVCDATVRPYFEGRQSLAELRGTQEELLRRRARLEEELRSLGGNRRPVVPTEDEGTGRARIQVLWPRPGDLQAVPMHDDTAGAKGLPFRAQVVMGEGVVEPGRLHRFVAQLGGRSFTVYGRADSIEGASHPVLAFRSILPAGLGPFELRLSAPDVPGIRAVTVRGAIVAPGGAIAALDEAKEALLVARAPEPGTDPLQVQQSLARAYGDVAVALMRLDRTKESLQAADQAEKIVKKHWPVSRGWSPVRGLIWFDISWLRAQDALARGDLEAVERLHLARARLFQQVIADERRRARETPTDMYFFHSRDAYRRLADHVVLLTGDLERARGHWRKGRTLLHDVETDAPQRPGFDPVWFTP